MMAAKAYENEQKQYLVNDLNYLANVLNTEISKNRLIEEGYVRNVLRNISLIVFLRLLL